MPTRPTPPDPHEALPSRYRNVQRTTTTLRRGCNLRGVRLAVLLDGFGRELRTTTGGIGLVAESGDDNYDKSEDVESLNYFLSHSWRAPWFAKYLALLFHFNVQAAAIATALVGVFITIYRWHQPYTGPPGPSDRCHYHALFSGLVVFHVVLLTWHRMPHLRGSPPMFFLDKVCIHQTDPVLKKAGIESIGAYLSHSDVMLVAWDATYFFRLWCTYELSAFKHARPNSPVLFVPISMGVLWAALIVSLLAAEGFAEAMVLIAKNEDWREESYFSGWLIASYILAVAMRKYVYDVEKMEEQLKEFSVREAECYCCTSGRCKSGHASGVSPEGGPLPCDRDVVNASIAHWQGHTFDIEKGLDQFDEMIRGPFRTSMMHALGGRCLIPYFSVVAAGIFPALGYLDIKHHLQEVVSRRTAYLAFDWAMVRLPIDIAIIMWLTKKSRWRPNSMLGKRIKELLMALAGNLILRVTWRMKDYTKGDMRTFVVWVFFSLLLLFLFYFRWEWAAAWNSRGRRDRRDTSESCELELEFRS